MTISKLNNQNGSQKIKWDQIENILELKGQKGIFALHLLRRNYCC